MTSPHFAGTRDLAVDRLELAGFDIRLQLAVGAHHGHVGPSLPARPVVRIWVYSVFWNASNSTVMFGCSSSNTSKMVVVRLVQQDFAAASESLHSTYRAMQSHRIGGNA